MGTAFATALPTHYLHSVCRCATSTLPLRYRHATAVLPSRYRCATVTLPIHHPHATYFKRHYGRIRSNRGNRRGNNMKMRRRVWGHIGGSGLRCSPVSAAPLPCPPLRYRRATAGLPLQHTKSLIGSKTLGCHCPAPYQGHC